MGAVAAAAAPWAVFLALVGGLLAPSLSGEAVVLPHDQLHEFLPWNADRPLQGAVHNHELRDVIDQYYPSQHAILTRLRAGEAGWLPDVGLGHPGWAFVGWGALSPFNLLAAVAPFDLAWSWGMALRLFVAMAGAYVLGRSFGMGRAASTVAGVAFGLCGYMVGWLGWPQSHVGAMLPWVWVGVRAGARPGRRWWSAGALGIATAFLWLGGFPAVAVWGLIGAAFVALHAAWSSREAGWRSVAGGAAAVAVGVGAGTALAAFTLLPSMLILDQFDLGYREQMWRARVPLAGLVTFVVPDYFGDVIDREFWLRPSYVETVGYAGVVTLALAVPAWVLSPRRPGVWLVTALAAGYTAVAYGWAPLREVVATLPLLSTNPPPRALAVVGLALALLGGFGADALVRWAGARLRPTWVSLVGAVLLALAGAAGWAAARPPAWLRAVARDHLDDPAAVRAALRLGQEEALLAALLVAATVVLVLGARLVAVPWPALGAGIMAVGLVGIVALDLGRFAAGWNPQVPRAGLFPDAPGLATLAEVSARSRVAGANRVGLPNTHLEYGFADLRARGFVTRRQRDVLERLDADFTSQTLWGLDTARSAGWEPWMTLLGVGAVITPEWVDVLPTRLEPDRDEVPGGPLDLEGTAVNLRAPRDGTIVGVLVRVGDFGRRNVGALQARVHAGGATVTGRVGLPGLTNRRPALVPVPPIAVTEGGRVDIRFTADVRDGASGVALFGVEEGGRLVPTVGLQLDGDHTYEPTDEGPVRVFTNPLAPDRVYAVGSARAVLPGRALDVLERLHPHQLTSVATVEALGDTPLTGVPTGGPAEVTDWSVAGGTIRARVAADDGALLVASQQVFDGWQATLDGEPVDLVRANHLFLGVLVPPGGGDVELRYVPAGLSAGVTVSAVAALLLLVGSAGAAWWARRTARRSSAAAHANEPEASAATVPATTGGQGDQASIADTPSP